MMKMKHSLLSCLCSVLVLLCSAGLAPAAETDFFSAIAAADTEQATEQALTHLLSTPVSQDVCADVVRQPQPIPFAKLSREDINISKSWISSAMVFMHITDESLAQFSEKEYPQWQKAFEKISKGHKTFKTDVRLFNDITDAQETSITISVFGEMINRYREETGADYVGFLMRPVGKVDWVAADQRKTLKVEVSLYNIPIEYRESIRVGVLPKERMHALLLNLETGSGELVNSAYLYAPSAHPILSYDDCVIVNPLCMRPVNGYYKEFPLIRKCELLSLGLPDDMLKRAAELRYVPREIGKDYLNTTFVKLLDKMAEAGVMDAERIAQYRKLTMSSLIDGGRIARGINAQKLMPLGFLNKRVENVMLKGVDVPRNARIVAEMGYMMAGVEIARHFGSFKGDYLEQIDPLLPKDASRTQVHMMLTAMNLMGYGPYKEKDIQDKLRFVTGPECSGLGTWSEEKGIMEFNYPARTGALYPAVAPDFSFRFNDAQEEKIIDAAAKSF